MMFMLKEIFIIVLVHACVGFSALLDFSEMDSIHDEMMKFYGGTKRTVSVLKPKLVAPPPVPHPRKKTSSGSRKMYKPVPHEKERAYMLKRVKGASGPMFGGSGASSSGGIDIGGYRAFRPHISEWSSAPSRRRPSPPKAKLTFVQQTKTYDRRKAPSNKFLEALNAIERGVADAKAAEKWNNDAQNVQPKAGSTTNILKLAVQNRMFQYARNKLGRTLYHLEQSTTKRPKRSTQTEASSFMSDLKKKLGSEKFDEFMAVMGDVTLMFAIDTSGSMSDDIDTAKKIAVDVINYPRKNPVSYILSPFNDPGRKLMIHYIKMS